jgi:hypothetical protein
MDFYETVFNFTHEDVTQLKYHLEILSNDTWYIFKTGFINLSSNPDNNIDDDNNIDYNKKNTTPGFELIFIILAVMLILFLRQKKFYVK